MTTNNLSRELCEICGIKPINKTIISCGCEDRTRHFRTYNPKRCQGCNTSIKARTYKEIHKVVFPDFTQPENFVKLEEIMLAELAKQRLTVVKYVHYYSDNTLMHEYILITKCGHKIKFTHNGIKVDNWFVEREDRTECLILFILWKVLPICGESIKQAIKSEVWIYD